MTPTPGRSRRAVLTLLLLTPALAGCGLFGRDEPPPAPPQPMAAPPPPPPPRLELTLRAATDVNQSIDGAGRPVRVSLYQLTSSGRLASADYATLVGNPVTTLGRDLLHEERLMIGPGRFEVLRRELDPAARVLGIVAAYREARGVVWRSWAELPGHDATRLEVELGSRGIGFRKAAIRESP